MTHPLTRSGNTHRYGPWIIADAGWLRPDPRFQVGFHHEDYDGAPDANDPRHGTGATVADCVTQIDEIEQENG